MNDGTFGVTGDAEPLSAELIDKLEKHEFEPVKTLQWRSSALDFSSIDKLKESLREFPDHARLTRARLADDVLALDALAGDADLAVRASSQDAVKLMWDVCQVPDYRKVAPASHAELVNQIYKFVSSPAGAFPKTGSPNRSARPAAPKATSIRFRTVSPTSAPGHSSPTARNGSPIRSIGRPGRARSRMRFRTPCTSS